MMFRRVQLLQLLSTLLSMSSAISWMTNTTEPWTFSCPTGQTFKIIDSNFVSYDRNWNFTCDDIPATEPVSTVNCEWSGFINQPGGSLRYQCHNDAIITGIASEYVTSNRDRMFRFQCCDAEDYVAHACYYTDYINNHQGALYYRVPDNMVIRGVDSEFLSYDRQYRFDVCLLDQIVVPGVEVGK